MSDVYASVDTVQIVSVSEAAKRLNTTRAAILMRIKRGTLPAVKDDDGQWRVTLPDTPQQVYTNDGVHDDGKSVYTSLPTFTPELQEELYTLRERVAALERENGSRTAECERWQQQADKWEQAHHQAMASASETRRLALIYAPKSKQRELAALMGASVEEMPHTAHPRWLWILIAVVTVIALGGVWLLFQFHYLNW